MKAISGFLGLFLFVLPISAQQKGQVPYIETLEVRVHSIDVVVTDAHGKPVTGLQQEDFELREEGKVRPITNFSAFSAPSKTAAPLPQPSAPEAAPAAEQRPPRKFIFYIDEMSMVQATRRKLLEQVNRLVETTMEPGDEAMVLRPAEQKKLASPFTSDRGALRRVLADAIERERWRNDTPIVRDLRQLDLEMQSAASAKQRRMAARRYADYVARRVQQRLGQLQAVVNAAAEVEGRKVLVLVTESLPLEPGREAFNESYEANMAGDNPFGDADMADLAAADWVDLSPLVEEIARTAATNGITIYAVLAEYGIGNFVQGHDIAGAAPSHDAAMNFPSGGLANASESRLRGGVSTAVANGIIDNSNRSLQILADRTGGKASTGAGMIDDLVDGIASDVRTYYSLGFKADADPDVARKIEVSVKGRPELRVRTRQEIMRKSPQREMTDRVVARLFEASNAANEIPIRLESKQVATAADRSYKTYWFAARVPLSALTFLPDGDTYKAEFSVHYAAMGEDADFVSGVAGTQVIEIPAARFESAKKEQYTYVVPMNLRPARHTVVIGVLDSISHLSGFASTEVSVK